MASTRILVFAGSLRRDSLNHALAVAAARGAASAEITELRLRDYPLPLYDEEIEEADGLPDNCLKLKDIFRTHHGLIVGCPEYNSAITGVMKNAIDWVSRPRDGEGPLECFEGKVVGLVAASPGGLGGIRGLPTVRRIFGHIRSIVLPEQFSLPNAADAFDDAGGLKSDDHRKAAEKVGRRVAEVAAAVGVATA
ncbi:MAG: NAD(P)H-dependent oxidoreductase [Planctomycetota bacterium]